MQLGPVAQPVAGTGPPAVKARMRSACCRQNSVHGFGVEQRAGRQQHEVVGWLGAVQQRPVDGGGGVAPRPRPGPRCRPAPPPSSRAPSTPAARRRASRSSSAPGRRADERHRRRAGPRGLEPAPASRAAARRAPGSAPATAPASCAAARSKSITVDHEQIAGAGGPHRGRARRRVSSASSPTASPRPSSRITAPADSSTTSRRPARTTYMASPGSPSRNSHSPAGTRTAAGALASCLEQRPARGRRTWGPWRGSRRRTRPGAQPDGRGSTADRAARAARRGGASPSPASRSTHPCGAARRGRHGAAQAADQQAAEPGGEEADGRRSSRRCRTRRTRLERRGRADDRDHEATPSAAPTWRATEFRPVAVAKLSPGAEATATPLRLGNSVPAPMPSSTIPGSHSPRKSGLSPARLDEPQHRPAPDQPAGDQHRPVARCAARGGSSVRRRRRPRTAPASARARPAGPSSATRRSGTGRWSACSRRSRPRRRSSSRWRR